MGLWVEGSRFRVEGLWIEGFGLASAESLHEDIRISVVISGLCRDTGNANGTYHAGLRAERA